MFVFLCDEHIVLAKQCRGADCTKWSTYLVALRVRRGGGSFQTVCTPCASSKEDEEIEVEPVVKTANCGCPSPYCN